MSDSPKAKLDKAAIQLLVAYLEHVLKQAFGERFLVKAVGILADTAGDGVQAKLENWLNHGETAEHILAAFDEADSCFKESIADPVLRDLMEQLPLKGLPLLSDMMRAGPVDNDRIGKTIDKQIQQDWLGINYNQRQIAVALYQQCLDDAFTDKLDALLPIYRTARRTENYSRETRDSVRELHRKFDTLTNVQSEQAEHTAQLEAPRELRLPPVPFVARENEIERVLQSIGVGGIIISGMPGSGKTALSLIVGNRIQEQFPDGQLDIDMKGRTITPLSATEVMKAIIFRLAPNIQAPNDEAIPGIYRTILRNKHVLILLDDATNADQITNLLPPQGSFVLVTSRERMAVSSLAELHLENFSPAASEQLLLTIEPRIGTAAAELATFCDGLPLALEMSARYLHVREDLLIEDFLAQLTNASRLLQITGVEPVLRVIYESLNSEGQFRWRALAAIPDAFHSDAAVILWGLSDSRAEGLDVLSEMLRRSKVQYSANLGLYRLHDLVRVFLLQKLSAFEQDELNRTLAYYLLQWLWGIESHLRSGRINAEQWLARFEPQWHTIKKIMAWAFTKQQDDPEREPLFLGLVIGSNSYIESRESYQEQVRINTDAISIARTLSRTELLAEFEYELALSLMMSGQVEASLKVFRSAKRHAENSGHSILLRRILGHIATAHHRLGQDSVALRYGRRLLQLARDKGDGYGVEHALYGLSQSHAALEQYSEAQAALTDALQMSQSPSIRADILLELGNLKGRQDQIDEATTYYEQALEIYRELGNRHGVQRAVGNLAMIYAKTDQWDKAQDYAEQDLALARETGDLRAQCVALNHLAPIFEHKGDIVRARQYETQSLGLAEQIRDPRLQAMAWRNLARYDAMMHDPAAITKLKTAIALWRLAPDPTELKWAEQLVQEYELALKGKV